MMPPMVMASLDRSSALLAALRSSGLFGVNVLRCRQASAALAFARKGGAEKFHEVLWTPAGGIPRLEGRSGWLVCDVAELIDGGDHVVLMGNVVEAENVVGSAPLTYHARTFGTHAPVPTADFGRRRDWADDDTFMRFSYCVG